MDASFWKGRRVLLTGHTGFKGAWLGFWLSELGADVVGLALPTPAGPSCFQACGLETRVRSVLGDVRDAPLVDRLVQEHRPEIVLHLAAQALVGVSYEDPVGTFGTNIMGTVSVLDACRRQAATRAVVVVTSDKSYEPHGGSLAHHETDPLGGHDPYSASKAATELVVGSFRRSFLADQGCGVATARAGNVFGGGDFTRGRLVPDCLAAFAASQPVRLRNPRAIRPWQHVLDPLAGYLALAEALHANPVRNAGGWNFGPPEAEGLTVGEVVEACAAAWGRPIAWEQEPGQHPHETHVLRLDSSKARTHLGWRTRWPLVEGLSRTVAWHRAFLTGQDVSALMRAQLAAHGDLHG